LTSESEIAARDRAAQFWAERLGCHVALLREPGLHFIPQADPCAVFIVAAGPSVVAAAPGGLERELAALFRSGRLLEPAAVETFLPGPAVSVGPAFVGYAGSVAPPTLAPIPLAKTTPELETLRAAVEPHEWQHANLEAAAPPLFALFRQGAAVSAAGAETLLGQVAHIGVLTHPAHRGRGLARQVVAAAAAHAHSEGLLPQYQTLLSNRAAVAVARAIGFAQFATTLSFRWGSAAA
jgi:GNAT superfamily N-acetyltransferase